MPLWKKKAEAHAQNVRARAASLCQIWSERASDVHAPRCTGQHPPLTRSGRPVCTPAWSGSPGHLPAC
jgi:hypothetical protein